MLSIFTCNSVAMFFLASSKLLPLTVTDKLLQSPFQPSSSDQKSQSIGMLALTCKFTTSEVINTPLESWLCKSIIVRTHGGRVWRIRQALAISGKSQPDRLRHALKVDPPLFPSRRMSRNASRPISALSGCMTLKHHFAFLQQRVQQFVQNLARDVWTFR